MEELNKVAEELKRIEEKVQKQFDKAKGAGQEIDEQIHQWLKKAQNIGDDIVKSNGLDRKAKSSWRKKWFPSNHQAKKSKEDVLQMINILIAEGKSILSVNFPPDTKSIELVWRDDFLEFNSRRDVIERIMEGLKDKEVGFIGIFGMGGIGKTKLVVEIGKRAKDQQLFTQVVMATVSQTPNIHDIQGKLADMLNLRFKEVTEIGRGNELRIRFKKESKILVILDDVWEKIDLELIGIPLHSDHKGCKIVLTTRREDVCQSLGCISPICLERIDEQDARFLFTTYAGVRVSPNMENTVKKIVKECAGLPLALVIVGTALKDKGLEEFEIAALKLSKSSFVDVESADRDIYACLKLSYDYLEDIETQKCFLLCSLYPEDTKIEVEELMRYAYGLGLFESVESVDEARQKIFSSITKLRNACLLSSVMEPRLACMPKHGMDYLSSLAEDDRYLVSFDVARHSLVAHPSSWVKMHDVVRDVALWITKSLVGLFLVSIPFKVFRRKDYEKATAISLVNFDSTSLLKESTKTRFTLSPILASVALSSRLAKEIHSKLEKVSAEYHKLPQYLECPELKILLMGSLSSHLPGNFFEKACSLQVLQISHRASVPFSLQYPVNLKMLNLSAPHWRDDEELSTICKLTSLEILDLGLPQRVKVLPEWIGELCNLRVLDLFKSPNLELIPCNLLPKLAKLEELYTPEYHITKWSDAFLSDLKSLPHLSVVTGTFGELKTGGIKDGGLNTGGLKVFSHKRPTALRLGDHYMGSLQIFKPLLQGVSCLDLSEGSIQGEGIKNFCPQIDSKGFQNLRQLTLRRFDTLECLIDPTPDTGHMLPNLIELSLQDVKQVRRIRNAPPLIPSFLKDLRQAQFERCHFESLVPDMLPVAPKLEALYIEHCDALKYVFSQVQTPVLSGPLDESRPGLSIESMLFSLINVGISSCASLKEIFPVSEMNNQHGNRKLANLVKLKLFALPNLEWIWNVWPHRQNYCLRNLQTIILLRCHKLSAVFTSTLARSLSKLQTLNIRDCRMLKTIISQGDHGEAFDERLHSSSMQSCFQEIKCIFISSCPKLKTVLPMAFVVEGLPKLQSISIKDCEMLEEVFGTGQENKATSQDMSWKLMKNLQFLELVDVPKLDPFSQFNWDLLLTSLKSLKIAGRIFKQASDIVIAAQDEECNGILPIRAAGSLEDLEVVSESFFSSVEEIFDVEEAQHTVVTELRSIKLGYMPNLHYLWKGPAEFFSPCNLREIEVCNCPAIKCLFTHSICQTLQSLETLKVNNCKVLKDIIEPNDSDEPPLYYRCFPKLESIHVGDCEILETLFPVFMVQYLPCLKSLQVEDCPKLENIFYVDMGSKEALESIRLQQVCDYDEFEDEAFLIGHFRPPSPKEEPLALVGSSSYVCFPKLENVQVQRCDRLKTLFPLSVAQHLPLLKKLHVKHASQLEQVFVEDRKCKEGDCNIMLPQWEKIVLEGLPCISSVSPQGYVLSGQASERLARPWPTGLIPRHIHSIVVNNVKSPLTKSFFSYTMAQTLQSVEFVNIINCMEIESVVGPEFDLKSTALQQSNSSTAICLPNLKILHVEECDQLRTIFSLPITQGFCENMENTTKSAAKGKAPVVSHGESTCSTAFFPELRYLLVEGCHKLRNIIPLSIVQSLSKLEVLTIKRASQVEQIFVEDQKEAHIGPNKLINLPELRILDIEQLPCLYSICPADYSFSDGPSYRITDCPLLPGNSSGSTTGIGHLQ